MSNVTTAMPWLVWCLLAVIAVDTTARGLRGVASLELDERISIFDSETYRYAFHMFRNFMFRMMGNNRQRDTRRINSYINFADLPFPCDIRQGRSIKPPTSVHKLRPGDVHVIAAMGDSLTAATGAISKTIFSLGQENRGVSWSIGGQWTWRNTTTLANILRVYNPTLVGFSFNDSLPFHRNSQFNVAEIGAVSSDMPFMTRSLIARIRADRRVNFYKDWKIVSILIGGNDICTFLCSMDNPEEFPARHRERMIVALRIIRDTMPRTYVNVVSVPPVEKVISPNDRPEHCQFLHVAECSCWIGRLYKQSDKMRERFRRIQKEMIRVEKEITLLPEFQGLKEFAAVHQPWTVHLNMIDKSGKNDYSLLSYDCFHLSHKGHSWAGTSLWNNMLEPLDKKTSTWHSPLDRFLCPTKEHPYFYTNNNG